MPEPDLIEVRVEGMRYEATDVLSLELRPYPDADLPVFEAGSHIDLHLNNGLVRSYSLINRPDERTAFRIAIYRDPASRGGSSYVHEGLRPGQLLRISMPRNNFRLVEDAGQSIFIAGGIGITPFLAMTARLNALGRPWRLFYCSRTPERAAFLTELQDLAALGQGELICNFDSLPGAALLDIEAVIAEAPPESHFYCCGPTGMLASYREAARAVPAERVHFEYFSSDVELAAAGGFTVILGKSGRRVSVPPGNTILDALIAGGMSLPYSCQQGVCGACEVAVMAGRPDHRDMILSEEERASNRTMLICCSGSLTPELVLDL